MSYRDGSGWRKKVTWDAKNSVYKYRGHEIFPLSWNERNRMPVYLQHNYYWDELDRIDHIEEAKGRKPSKDTEPAWIGFERAFDYFDGDESAFDRLLSYYEKRGRKIV